MKLGDRVKFRKSLVKTGDSVIFGYMTEDQEKELEDKGYIELVRWQVKDPQKELEGILCGKRRITISNTLEYDDNPYRTEEGLVSVDSVEETVYLVACDLRGFYRVKEEDLEVRHD